MALVQVNARTPRLAAGGATYGRPEDGQESQLWLRR